MKRSLPYILRFIVLFMAFCLGISPLVEYFSVSSVTPNFLFTFLFCYALFYKEKEVLIYAIILGSVTDLLFGKIYGVTTLLLIAFTLLFFLLKKIIFSESKFSVAVITFILSAMYEIIVGAINLGKLVFTFTYFEVVFAKSIYNALLAILIFVILKKINNKRQEEKYL